jgi:hypothetical protein
MLLNYFCDHYSYTLCRQVLFGRRQISSHEGINGAKFKYVSLNPLTMK